MEVYMNERKRNRGVDGEYCIDNDIRYPGACGFNHYVKFNNWSNPIAPVTPMSDVEEEENRETLIFSDAKNPEIRSQLREALYVIIGHDKDFAKEWPSFLQKLSLTSDYASINLLLAILNSLFLKFRSSNKTDALLVDLNYCIDIFANPLLELFKQTATLIDQLMDSGKANASILKPYTESQRLCCCIFYSFNSLKVHDFFKTHVHEWMITFKKCLTIDDFGVDDGYLLDDLRVAVCENIALYVIKEEKLIHPYLSDFVKDVLSLVVCCNGNGNGNGREQLTVSAIKFMITVCNSGHHALFSSDYVLQRVWKSIVIPNLMLSDEEEMLFKTDPMQYIKRDMDGSLTETKRGIAIELLKGIAIHYKDKAGETARNEIAKCFKLYAGRNWKYKDCAIRLVVSLATQKADETTLTFADVEILFDEFFVQRLDLWDSIYFPKVTAEALKFLTLFRNQISKKYVLPVLPEICKLLNSSNLVVHSYAAICIEKLLLIKDCRAQSRYTPDDILPILLNLITVCTEPEFTENEYGMMKCIMRVVCVGDLTVDAAFLCLEGLTTTLDKACQNPNKSLFNHYLFESLTALIRGVSGLSEKTINKKTRNIMEPLPKTIYLISQLEKKLYPRLQMILVRDIREFFPYAFKLLAELADLNRPLLTKYYTDMFDAFRLPDTWTRSGENALQKWPFLRWGLPHMHKLSMIGIYNKLVLSPDTEYYGYDVLNTVVENLGFEVISPFVRNVWISLFNRLQHTRRVESVKKSLVLMSELLLKDGPRNLVKSVNAVQPDGFEAILEQVWIPNLKLIEGGSIELKLISIASTQLICQCPDILDMKIWGKDVGQYDDSAFTTC